MLTILLFVMININIYNLQRRWRRKASLSRNTRVGRPCNRSRLKGKLRALTLSRLVTRRRRNSLVQFKLRMQCRLSMSTSQVRSGAGVVLSVTRNSVRSGLCCPQSERTQSRPSLPDWRHSAGNSVPRYRRVSRVIQSVRSLILPCFAFKVSSRPKAREQ